jgi:hypothetical protein
MGNKMNVIYDKCDKGAMPRTNLHQGQYKFHNNNINSNTSLETKYWTNQPCYLKPLKQQIMNWMQLPAKAKVADVVYWHQWNEK